MSLATRICVIGKYPPIEGGVSATTYWLARRLAELGSRVDVVTNAAEVELSYRIYTTESDNHMLEGDYDSGGRLRLHCTHEPSVGARYIPYANPYVTKLAAMAVDVVREYDSQFILSYYMEPYGMAAALASRWTGVPYGVRHAGSDIGRLARIPARRSAYVELLRDARIVICSGTTVRYLVREGIPPENLLVGMPAMVPPELFTPIGPKLDVDAVVERTRGTVHEPPFLPTASYTPDIATIGIYGKAGPAKGTVELVRALEILARRGIQFNFLMMCGVRGKAVEELAEVIRCGPLSQRTFMLPFLPHWVVPTFIRRCDVVCFLENRFPIGIHRPQIPREVTQCGRCLVISSEILEKQPIAAQFRDGENVVRIDDPRDVRQLAAQLAPLLGNSEVSDRIGAAGRELFDAHPTEPWIGQFVDRVEEEALTAQETLRDFQQAVFSYYIDSNFRARLTEGGHDDWSDANISRQQAEALQTLAGFRSRAEVFAKSLRRKKFRYLSGQFRLLKEMVPSLMDEAWVVFEREYDFAERTVSDELSYFADLLTHVADRTAGGGPWIVDIIRFDLVRRKVALCTADLVEEWKHTTAISGVHLRTNPCVQVQSFEFAVSEVLASPQIDSLREERETLAFVPRDDMFGTHTYEVGPMAAYLVEAARQGRTVTELEECAAKVMSIDDTRIEDLRLACAEALEHLVEWKILVLCEGDTKTEEFI